MRSAARLAAGAAFVLKLVAGLLLLAMMVLTTVDVVGRYLFASPVPGAFEATEIMLALVIFAGLPLVTAAGGHVQVRLLLDALPGRIAAVLDRLGAVVVAAMLAGAAWLLYGQGNNLAAYGDATVLLSIPLAPVAYTLCALCGAASVIAAGRAVRGLARERAAKGFGG